DGVIVEIKTHVDGFACADSFYAVGIETMLRQRNQARLFLGEDLIDSAIVLLRPAPLMRYLIAPQPCLPIAFGQRGETAAGPEGVADVANGALHASLLVTGADLTGLRFEMIVRREFDQTRIEENLIATPLQHGAFEVVIQYGARLFAPGF